MHDEDLPQLDSHKVEAENYGCGGRRVARDLFPLPVPTVEPPARSCLSRGCKQRIGKRREVEKEVCHTVRSLNFLHGGSGWDPGQSVCETLCMSAAQEKSLEFIGACVAELGGPGSIDGSEALQALRISEDYGGTPAPSALGSFDPELISLPAEELKPNDLAMLWGEDGHSAVKDFIRKQVLTREEASIQLREAGVERCYSDPLLRHQPTFCAFVKRLWKLGLVDLSTDGGVEHVELFCVKKKQSKLRLIVDCRRSNSWFRAPENVRLTSGDSLSKIELGEDEELFVCSADLQNAFYTMKMPEELRKFFCLRSVTAKEIGLTELNGKRLRQSDRLTPRMAVLPMGWAWALWWCQRLHERIAERAGLLPSERLQDFCAPPLGKFWHVQYVDNLHVMGTNRGEVLSRFRRAVSELRCAGLTVHEEEEFEEETKILGWQYDNMGKFRPSRQRVWRVRLALRHLLKRGRASGQEIERLLGHITFIALGRRETLSIFGECYTFIQKHYRTEVPLWKSVRFELNVWDGIAPLVVQDLRSPWVPQISAVDASEWGLGVCVGEVSVDECRELGRYNERWRFRLKNASRARAFILADDQFQGEPCVAVEADFTIDDVINNFETVPFPIVKRTWQVVGRHRWQYAESMPVYEARATLHAVRHQLRKVSNHGKRHLVLSDSMTATLAFSKGRAHAHRLRRVVQQTSSYLLATGSNLVVRWVPSEWNPADNPSRGQWEPSVPKQRLGDGSIPRSAGGGDMASESQKECEKGEAGSCGGLDSRAATAGSSCLGSRDVKGAEQAKEEAQGRAETGKGPVTGTFKVCEPEDGVSEQCYPEAISTGERRLCGVAAKKEDQGQVQGARELLGALVPGGRRPLSGDLHCSSPCSLRAGNEIPSQHAKGSADLEGVAQDVPTSQPNAPAVRGGLPGCCESHRSQQARDRPGLAPHILPLPSADGVRDVEDSGHCQAGERGKRGVSPLEHPFASHGGRSSFKDLAMGRESDLGPRAHEAVGPSHGSRVGFAEKAQESAQLHYQQPGSHRVHEGYVAPERFAADRGATHVPTETRGGHLRVSKQAPPPSGSPTSREMEGFEEPEKLRKRRATGTNVRQPQRGHTATVHRGGAKPRSAPAQPALKPQCSLKLPVFLEIFSGSGRLGRAVGRVVGIAVLLWDINFVPEYDLTNPSIQHRVMEWIRTGYVVAGHLGTPCGSFSRARDRPGGPPRLRSDECPLGLEGLKPHDAQKVAVGNILMRFTVRVMLLALRMILPFTLENPARSRLWLCPPIRALLRRKHVRVQQVEYCSFGMPWKKSTLFVAVHLVLHTLEPYRCIGAKRGLCNYSGHAHVPLAGQLPDGRWMTHVAEPYPNKLCTVLAGCFRDFYVSRIADNLAQHL